MALRDLIVRIRGDSSRLDKALGKASRNIGSFAAKTTKRMASLTAVAAGAGVLAAGAFAGQALQSAIEFEDQIAKVHTLLGSDMSLDGARRIADELLDVSVIVGDTTETMEAAYQALSAGVSQNDLIPFMEVMAKTAKAGFTTIETAVGGASAVLNAYKAADPTLTAQKVADIFLNTQNMGVTTVEELGRSLGNVTPIASSLGIAFEDVSAALALMTAAYGGKTAEATTQLRQLFGEASKTGTKLSTAIMDITGQSFSALIAGGTSFAEIIHQVRKELGEQSFADLFGSTEAKMAALLTTGSGFEDFLRLQDAMVNSAGSLDAGYATVAGTIGAMVDQFKQMGRVKVTALGQDIYQTIQDVMERADFNLLDLFDTKGFKRIERAARTTIYNISDLAGFAWEAAQQGRGDRQDRFDAWQIPPWLQTLITAGDRVYDIGVQVSPHIAAGWEWLTTMGGRAYEWALTLQPHIAAGWAWLTAEGQRIIDIVLNLNLPELATETWENLLQTFSELAVAAEPFTTDLAAGFTFLAQNVDLLAPALILLLPVVKALALAFLGFAVANAPLLLMAAAIAGLVALVGYVNTRFGEAQAALVALLGTIALLTIAMIVLTGASLPLALLLAALAAGGIWLWRNWDAVAAGVTTIWQNVVNALTGFWTLLVNAFRGFWDNIRSIWELIPGPVQKALTIIGLLLLGPLGPILLLARFVATNERARAVVEQVWEAIKSAFVGALDRMGRAWKGFRALLPKWLGGTGGGEEPQLPEVTWQDQGNWGRYTTGVFQGQETRPLFEPTTSWSAPGQFTGGGTAGREINITQNFSGPVYDSQEVEEANRRSYQRLERLGA